MESRPHIRDDERHGQRPGVVRDPSFGSLQHERGPNRPSSDREAGSAAVQRRSCQARVATTRSIEPSPQPTAFFPKNKYLCIEYVPRGPLSAESGGDRERRRRISILYGKDLLIPNVIHFASGRPGGFNDHDRTQAILVIRTSDSEVQVSRDPVTRGLYSSNSHSAARTQQSLTIGSR